MSVDPRNVVIARISAGLSDMLGDVGARSSMRASGRASSDYLWEAWPEHLAPEEACDLLSEALGKIGMFQTVRLKPANDGNVAIEIQGCEFSRMGTIEAAPVGERSICFFGFGLIERSLERLTGQKFRITLDHHDASSGTCFEIAQLRR